LQGWNELFDGNRDAVPASFLHGLAHLENGAIDDALPNRCAKRFRNIRRIRYSVLEERQLIVSNWFSLIVSVVWSSVSELLLLLRTVCFCSDMT
jgi:hypothetical protein